MRGTQPFACPESTLQRPAAPLQQMNFHTPPADAIPVKGESVPVEREFVDLSPSSDDEDEIESWDEYVYSSIKKTLFFM